MKRILIAILVTAIITSIIWFFITNSKNNEKVILAKEI